MSGLDANDLFKCFYDAVGDMYDWIYDVDADHARDGLNQIIGMHDMVSVLKKELDDRPIKQGF